MNRLNFQLLEKNCQGLDKVVCVQQGIDTQTGVKCYTYDEHLRFDAYSLHPINADALTDHPRTETVNTVTPADLLRQLSLSKIDYVKMDIEGTEIALFAAGQLDWLQTVQQISIEVHDEQKLDLLLTGLKQAGFTAYRDTRHWCAVMGVR